MRVLVYSRAFLPMVGGLELNIAHLCEAWARRGNEVVVVTTTPGAKDASLPYKVVRHPGLLEFLEYMQWCDIYHQPNVSLRGWWPLALVRRPWVVSHHSWYRRPGGALGWQDYLKRSLLQHAAGSIAVSKALAADLETPCEVVENSYQEGVFRVIPGIARDRDIVFVGRLVSEKGVALLLAAVARLGAKGIRPTVTVIGEGPEWASLERQAIELGIAHRVTFTGVKSGDELARILNAHKVLAVPSLYNEPFGIVALEGIACGCYVVGSAGGGLAGAIGPCGMTFPNGDELALSTALERVLVDPVCRHVDEASRLKHLADHGRERQIGAYLRVFERVLATRAE